MTPGAALDRGLGELGLELGPAARDRLLDYVALLVKWNRTYNLTAIRDPLAMVTHHLLDSLSVLPHLPLAAARARIADAGSGAGLPGIPIAIARPRWHVSLAESSQKKAAFLRQAAIELALDNIEVHEGRVEAWRPQPLFDLVISRAFAALADFIDACRHLVVAGGTLAAMKGAKPTDLQAECSLIPLHVPLLEAQRHLVLCPASSR
ncbi:MAG TPA: 16S rRNA (guanine(527)-N(7))-methyltransferase RsmG [Burkholderiales bacterium]|nr:16S rRNA (guanine(527)-N(7))-methyltransferase RsmG [Burkholderiales bacterium]